MAAEPTRLVLEPQPGLPPAANRLVAGPRPWIESVMELVGLDAPGPDIHVVLAPESSPYARGAPAWVSGYTDGVTSDAGSVVVLLAERTPSYPDGGLEEVLAHEVAHVLIHRASGGRRVPRWFDEGVAMLAARSWSLRDQTELALGLLSGPRVPLWELDDLFQGDRRQVEHGYALSGTLVQDLLERYGSAVPRIVLARVARGDTFDEAIRGATGATLLDVGEAFYARQATLKRWIPILTSSAVLWFGISVLAIVAGIRRRRRRMQLEEEAAELEAGSEAEQPPDDTVN
ncbi:MAG: peptidase MA family metallohydrolase [Thermoanaerobaculia bacterium]